MKHTNKKDIASRIYASNNEEIPILTVLKVVSQTFDAMRYALSKGEGVEVRGFGSFRVVKTKPKLARKPLSPTETMMVPARMVAKFRMARELKKQLNETL